MTTEKESERERIDKEFREHLSNLTNETIKEYYTAQYKAALLGLIQFSGKTPDELTEEVHMWLHYNVDNFSDPVKKIPHTASTPLNCIYGIDDMPCEDCEYGDRDNSQSPCCSCHHAKSCMFKSKEGES